MSSKLLQALRSKYRSPQEACDALGIDAAAVLPAQARYSLAADAKSVTNKHTGETYDSGAFCRVLWSTKEDPMLTTLQRKLARLAKDQAAISRPDLPGQPKTMINDQDDPTNGGSAPPDTDEMIALIWAMLAKAPDPQGLLEALAALVSEQSSGAGALGAGDDAPNNNLQVLDRRSVRVHDRRPVQDSAIRSLNHSSFMRRFPMIKDVDVWR